MSQTTAQSALRGDLVLTLHAAAIHEGIVVIATRLFAAVAFSVVAACSDPVAPLTFIGYYPLRAVNGAPPPGTVRADPDGCTRTFQFGSLFLADGAFSLLTYDAVACPGLPTGVGFTDVGGGLAVRGGVLILHAIDPTSPFGETFDAQVVIQGTDAVLTFPPGALDLAESATLVFGPRRASAISQSGARR